MSVKIESINMPLSQDGWARNVETRAVSISKEEPGIEIEFTGDDLASWIATWDGDIEDNFCVLFTLDEAHKLLQAASEMIGQIENQPVEEEE